MTLQSSNTGFSFILCFVFSALVLLFDGPESQVRVPGGCLCTRHGQSLGALLCSHQAQQGQLGLPCGRLVVLHVALFPSSPAGAPQSPGQHQAGLTGLEGGAATAASSERPPQTTPGPVMHPGLLLPFCPPLKCFSFLNWPQLLHPLLRTKPKRISTSQPIKSDAWTEVSAPVEKPHMHLLTAIHRGNVCLQKLISKHRSHFAHTGWPDYIFEFISVWLLTVSFVWFKERKIYSDNLTFTKPKFLLAELLKFLSWWWGHDFQLLSIRVFIK